MSREIPEFTVSVTTKFSFIACCLLFLIGVVAAEDSAIIVSLVGFLIIGAQTAILEKLHEIQHQRMGGD